MSPRNNFDYLIVGAGFAGLSTAYFLMKRNAGRICIMERAREPGSEASGKNASLVRQVTDEPTVTRMAVEGARLLREDFETAMPDIHFHRHGSLLLMTEERLARLQTSIQVAHSHGIRLDILSREATIERFPFLGESDFEKAVLNPQDGTVDTRLLCTALSQYLREHGVHYLASAPCRLRRRADGLFETDAAEGVIQARVVVNAAGAWAQEVAEDVKAQDLRLKSFRRHIFVTEGLDWVSPKWPFVWDLTHGVYFRPDNHSLLFSPCDEDPQGAGPTPVNPEIETLLHRKAQALLPHLGSVHYARSWAGLRTFAPDRKFVIGWDAEVPGFFWVVGLGGHGLTASASIGRLASFLLLNENLKGDLGDHFSPKRFARA